MIQALSAKANAAPLSFSLFSFISNFTFLLISYLFSFYRTYNISLR